MGANSDDDAFVARFGINSVATSIKEKDIEGGNILIYPNPNTGQFNIAVNMCNENNELSVYNTTGSLVHSQQFYSETTTFDANFLPNGLYIVQLKCNSNIHTGKLIISK